MPFIEINRLESLSRLLHRSIRILLLLLAPKWLWYRRAPCSSDVVRRLRPHMANHCNESPGLDERIHCGMAENYPAVITVLLDAVQAHARYRSPREQSNICAPYGQLDLPAAIFGNRFREQRPLVEATALHMNNRAQVEAVLNGSIMLGIGYFDSALDEDEREQLKNNPK